MKKSLIIAAVALMPAVAFADGFVAVGGAAGGCHYAVEPVLAAYADGVHHGILAPFADASGAGVATVAAPSELALSYDAAAKIIKVDGASASASVALAAMDGRTLPCTIADGTTISLSNLSKGIYIVRVADGAACATLKIAL